MPKTQVIHPSDLRRAGRLEMPEIPLNQYNKSFEEELRTFSPENARKKGGWLMVLFAIPPLFLAVVG